MLEEFTRVEVTCDGCGYTVNVGNDPNCTCEAFNAQDADNAYDAAIETLVNHYGYSYNYDDEEIFCPVCTHAIP